MLYIYRVVNGQLENYPVDLACETKDDVLWIDLIAPTDAERAFVEKYFKLPWITLGEEMEDLELNARFYEDIFGLHLLSLFLSESCQIPAGNTSVRFVVQSNRIFTIRERELKAFSAYRTRIQKEMSVEGLTPYGHLLNLLEVKTELLADELEFIYRELDTLNERLLQHSEETTSFDFLLVWLAKLEASSNKLRLCLTDTQRALMFLSLKKHHFSPDEIERSRNILGNVESIIPHNESVCARIEFLTQTTMGFSEIRQNHTMKWMSRLSVFSLPSTILTSWLGMDLHTFFGTGSSTVMFQMLFFCAISIFSYFFYLFMRRLRYF